MSFAQFFSFQNILDTFGLYYVNGYPFLMVAWDIFLALVPFFFFLLFRDYWEKTKFKKSGQKILAGLIFSLWFIFLPNSTYVIVVVRHLLGYCPIDSPNNVCVADAWQIMFFFAYSIFGWVIFTILLKKMQRLLAEIFSRRAALISVFIIIPLVSFGVLLGLTERFNSWDIFFDPLAILQNLLRYMADWEYFRNFLVFTAGYYFLYFFGVYLFGEKIRD